MAKESVLEKLIVRLVGDHKQYKQMLAQAQRDTKVYTDKMGRLHDQATGRFVSGQAVMAGAMIKTGQQMRALGAGAARLGRSLQLRLTAPILLIGGLAARSFAKFDDAMMESLSIMDTTTEQAERMRRVVMSLSMSGQVVQGPTDLAKAYFFLASAGKNAEQSMALMPKVASFATAGAFDMALATDLLTDAQSALGLSTRNVIQDTINLTRVSDVLVKANTLANASVQQFSIALTRKAGAALKSFNKDIEEGVAVLAAMADQGIKAELAGTQLDRVIRLLSKSSLENAEAHQILGFRVFDEAGRMRNLGEIMGNLEDILRGMTDQQKVATLAALGFEARIQQAILPLLGTSAAIKRYEDQLRDAQGITDEVSKKQLQSFAKQMKIVWNRIGILAKSIGATLAPWLEYLGRKISNWVRAWEGLSGTTKKVIVGFALLVAAIGPLLAISSFLFMATGLLVQAYGTLSVVLGVAKLKMIAFHTAAIGLTGALAVGVIVGFRAALAELNLELDETITRVEKLSKKRLESIGGLAGEDRTKALQSERQRREAEVRIAQQELQKQRNMVESSFANRWSAAGAKFVMGHDVLAAHKQRLDDAKKALQEFNEFEKRLGPAQGPKGGNEALQRTAMEVAEAERKAAEVREAAAKRVAQVTGSILEGLQLQVAGLSMSSSELEIWKLQMAGASKEAIEFAKSLIKQRDALQKENDLIEEGKRVTEKYLSPQEKYMKNLDHVNMLFREGKISRETLNRATADAKKQLDEELKKVDTKINVDFNVRGVEAVQAGSAAAIAQLQRHQDIMRANRGGAPGPGQIAQRRGPRMWWELQPSVTIGPGHRPAPPTGLAQRQSMEAIATGIKRLVELAEADAERTPLEELLEAGGLEG